MYIRYWPTGWYRPLPAKSMPLKICKILLFSIEHDIVSLYLTILVLSRFSFSGDPEDKHARKCRPH